MRRSLASSNPASMPSLYTPGRRTKVCDFFKGHLHTAHNNAVLLPPATEQPGRVNADQYGCKAEPSEGIAEVIVRQVRSEAARMGQAAGRFGAFQFDVEGSDGDAFGGRHGGGIAGEPGVVGRVVGRREQAGLLRPTQHADHTNRARDLTLWAGR